MNRQYNQFVRSIVGFTALLNKAGISVSTDLTIKAVRAVSLVALNRYGNLYWALKASLLTSQQNEEIFNQVFALYWGNAKLPDSALAVTLPRSRVKSNAEKFFSRRTQEAIASSREPAVDKASKVELVPLSWSANERVQTMDFEGMSYAEFVKAEQLLDKLKLSIKTSPTRRFVNSVHPRQIDFRRSVEKSGKLGFQVFDFKYRKPKLQKPSIVLFIDISGSMNRYSRILLRFAHLLIRASDRVHVFLFATRLSVITRLLKNKDIDASLQQIGSQVVDWNSGTKIGECLKHFNRDYLKSSVNSKTQILFVTDALDRGDEPLLERQLYRLKRCAKTLIWLNPLMRYEAYEPLAKGARIMDALADRMLPIHNLTSLSQLIESLNLKQMHGRSRAV